MIFPLILDAHCVPPHPFPYLPNFCSQTPTDLPYPLFPSLSSSPAVKRSCFVTTTQTLSHSPRTLSFRLPLLSLHLSSLSIQPWLTFPSPSPLTFLLTLSSHSCPLLPILSASPNPPTHSPLTPTDCPLNFPTYPHSASLPSISCIHFSSLS